MTITSGDFMRYIGMFVAWSGQQPVLSVFLFFSCVRLFFMVIGEMKRVCRGDLLDIDDEQTDTDNGRYSFANYSPTNYDAGYEYFKGN